MVIENLFLIIVAVSNLILGGLVYFNNRKSLVNRVFGIWAFSLTLWSINSFLFYVFGNSPSASLLLGRLLYATAVIIVVTLLYFTEIFPDSINLKRRYTAIIFAPATLLFIFTIASDLIIEDIAISVFDNKAIFGPLFILYALFIIIYVALSVFILIRKYQYVQNNNIKIHIHLMLIGIATSGFFGITATILLPMFNVFNVDKFGPVSTVFMVGFMAYAIAKYNVMNIKVIATKFLGILLSFVLFINLIFSKTASEFLINIIIFFAGTIISYLLVKSASAEINIRKKLENLTSKLQIANEDLRKLDETKTEFMSLASHQLRTPLTSIKGYSSMIKSGDFGKISSEQKEPLDIIFMSTENMNNLIDDFLNASRIEKKRGFDYNFVVDNPINLIKEIIDNLSIQIKNKGLKFVYENKINKEVKIKFDNRTLLQAISNLIQNAIKYTNNGSITVKISRTNNHLEFSVKDSGIGMTSDDLKMLFKRFFRSESVKIDHPEGTGLGLYLAERIILDHGGKIWAESKGIGKGSSFFITLPVVKE